MCKKILFALNIFLIFTLFSSFTYGINVSANGALLLEPTSGDIVYQKNAHQKMPMASTTKIMTAIVAIENNQLDTLVKIPKEATSIEGSSIYLKEGEIFTIRELLYALLLESANDSAVALAYITSGGVDEFATLMNQKACELELVNTHFTNPHGLDDEDHYTSPYDLAKLSSYAMSNPIFSEIVSTFKTTIGKHNGEDGVRYLVNHNKLLRSFDGAIGIKTGFTKKSGRCLVSCAEKDGVRLICVTLNDPCDWNDHKTLLDYGFTQYESINLANELDYIIELPLINGETRTVYATNFDSLKITLPKGEKNISAKIICNNSLSAPIYEGDLVGKIIFYNYEDEIAALNLYATNTIKNTNKKSLFERLFK